MKTKTKTTWALVLGLIGVMGLAAMSARGTAAAEFNLGPGLDLKSNLKVLQSGPPISSTVGAVNGASHDVSNYGTVLGFFAVGDIGASTTFDGKLQDSDDNSTWADVSGAAITQIGATGDNAISTILQYRRGNVGTAKKYLRLVGTIGGSNAVVWTGVLIGGNPGAGPV